MSENSPFFYTSFVSILTADEDTSEVSVDIEEGVIPHYDTMRKLIVLRREKDERMEYASLFHELGHHFFTGELSSDKTHALIINAVEDVRIERYIVEKYPSVKSDLLASYKRVREKMGSKVIDNPIYALRILLENKSNIFEDVKIDPSLKKKLDDCMNVCDKNKVLEKDYHTVYSVSLELKKILFGDDYEKELSGIEIKYAKIGKKGSGSGSGSLSKEEHKKKEKELKKLEEKREQLEEKTTEEFKEGYEEDFSKKTYGKTTRFVGGLQNFTLEDLKSKGNVEEKTLKKKKGEAKETESVFIKIGSSSYELNSEYTKHKFAEYMTQKVRITTLDSEEVSKLCKNPKGNHSGWESYKTDPEEFKKYDSVALRISSELCRHLKFKNKQSSKRKHGVKLNMKSITRDISKHGEIKDNELFYNKKDVLGNHSVLILVDFSGSMVDDKKILNARKSLYILTKILEDLKINHAVHGFSAHGIKKRQIMDYELKSFDDFSTNIESLRKAFFLNQWFHNRDGGSIQHAVDLLSRENGKKLLIVISDGLPTAVDYCGEGAIAEMKFRVDTAINQGINVLGISIDKEADYVIKKVYPTNYSFSDNLEDLIVGLTEKYLEALEVW